MTYSMCHYCGSELTQTKDEKKEHDNVKTLTSDRACEVCAEKQGRGSIKQGNVISMPTISSMTSLSSSDSSVSNYSEWSVDMSSNERTVSRNNDRLWEPPSANTGGSFDETEESNTSEGELDDWIWDPPQPDAPVDDVEGSVAFNDDDDDECGDGMKWGEPSSLNLSKEEGSGSYKFKEEKQRAMEAVMNGKFKALVSQLLASVGVLGISGEDGESWVDIITSLSWDAASFLKPDGFVGKAMDPDGNVKVKCIATGDRSQSQLVKGMVFKKHAAHKHMPTNYKNPRLLLIQGVLGQSSNGLSSFDSMEQEKDYLKSVTEMLEQCNPNVVLVEKTVSRDIQESILAKRMTLVYDMKFHRLQRIAGCTRSPILSADSITSRKLKQCDSFHIEKFIEEHAGSSGGKMPSKNLMFIEGCPTRQGCTILLKGAQSDELKKIKYVVQCAVILAYHLILETSFLVDQRAMFSSHPLFGGVNHLSTEVANQISTGNKSFNLASSNSCIPHHRESSGETEPDAVDILISDGNHEGCFQNANFELQGSSALYEPYNPVIFSAFSSLSASLKKGIGESLPLASYQSLSSYFGLNGRELNDQITKSVSISSSPEATDQCDVEDRRISDEERPLSGGEIQSPFTCTEASLEVEKDDGNNEDPMHSKNGISKVLDSQSILVLMSRKNTSKGIVCEQSHFSHIMFYKNFDVPIGKFLQDNILNQRSHCKACGELPEAHLYCYAHHNKQLTIQVKQLHTKHLPGEAEGKLWMWSRCGKCRSLNGKSKCTKRVLISSAARCLSFGNFLELSFSNYSLSHKIPSCGHSLHTDFLYFFGLGPLVAMFKISPVTIYTVSVPPLKLPFSNSSRQDWFAKEIENVLEKGYMLLSEVGNSLKKIRSQFDGMTLKLQGSLKKFSDIEDMLRQEESEREANIHNAVNENRNSDQAAYKLLGVNRVHWELLLQSCIWDHRLHSLLSPPPTMIHSLSSDKVSQEVNSGVHSTRGECVTKSMGRGENCIDGSSDLKVDLDIAAEAEEVPIKEIPIDGPVEESEGADQLNMSTMTEGIETSNASPTRFADHKSNPRSNASIYGHSDKYSERKITVADELDEDGRIPVARDIEDSCSIVDSDLSLMGTSLHSRSSKFDSSSDWFWGPFSEIRQACMKDLQRVLPRFEPMSSYTSEYLPTAYQMITEEGQMLHIHLGTGSYIVSDYDGELSSVIACALAFLKDPPIQTDVVANDASGIATRTFESLQSLARVPTINLQHQTSTGSSDSDSLHSMASISFDESRFSSFDGLNLLDSLVPPGTHPMVTLRIAQGKEKYTVLCPYANQFRDLRKRCCQSEVDYIASLSRCRNWDAKGGKSKAFFAKTVDDRLIIKEIKKTEFESFVKFANDYFEHMNKSFEIGNQTCLAKILGIYQVVVRQTKSGKEIKHDLMVMENLTFGRNCTRWYDLKGALHDRLNSAPDDPGNVLLDQNFVNDMNSSPFYLSNQAKKKLQRALWNDTAFLNSINVMDYSLLVGIDTHKQELVCGIIDYLRQYTWDKHLESWVKSSLVPKNVLPTVISPKEYKRRFRKFMSKNIWSVPDHWCSSESSDPCDNNVAISADSPKQNPKGKEG